MISPYRIQQRNANLNALNQAFARKTQQRAMNEAEEWRQKTFDWDKEKYLKELALREEEADRRFYLDLANTLGSMLGIVGGAFSSSKVGATGAGDKSPGGSTIGAADSSNMALL